MGTLLGHLVPGSLFLLQALWWAINIFRRLSDSETAEPAKPSSGQSDCGKYRNTATMDPPPSVGNDRSCCSRSPCTFPLESTVKILVSAAGMVGEAYTGLDSSGGAGGHRHIRVNPNGHHMVMYGSFMLSGLLDLAERRRQVGRPRRLQPGAGRRPPLALLRLPGLDYFGAIVALVTEAFLFVNHLHSRSDLDQRLHSLLVIPVVGTALSYAAELCPQLAQDPRPALLRCLFTLWHGSWFFQIGFMLYPPGGSLQVAGDHGGGTRSDHGEQMGSVSVAVMAFPLHLLGCLMALVCVDWATQRCLMPSGWCNRCSSSPKDYSLLASVPCDPEGP